MESERRHGVEFRVSGRTLSGRVMTYGDISPGHRERFLPGAFGPAPRAPLNIQHDSSLVVLEAGDFVLADSTLALSIRAELQPGSAALSLVKRGALNGYSVEFVSRQESRDHSGVRVIEKAELTGVGLVDQPSYPDSKAEVRRRLERSFQIAEHRGTRLATLRGSVPTGRKTDCQCAPGDCDAAFFEDGSLDNVPSRARDILAVVGEYSAAIASRDRGGLRLRVADGGALDYEVDIPDNARGRALMDTLDSVPVYGRPVIDSDASDYVIKDRVATYRKAEVRALTIGPTDAALGWTALELADNEDGEDTTRAARARRWIWL